MELRSIGSLRVSVVGLGCNNFGMRIDAAATDRVVGAALDAGITCFDTADVYGSTQSEEFLGRSLVGRRHRAVVATKFGMAVDETRRGARPDYIRRACEDSLQRLGTDYIDLYQLHEPDPDVPIADTLGALDALVKAGKVREIGGDRRGDIGGTGARERGGGELVAHAPGAGRGSPAQLRTGIRWMTRGSPHPADPVAARRFACRG